jgi:hypothetical protein
MTLIVTGCLVLSWPSGGKGLASLPGTIAIVAACLFWGLDNNLTRAISAADPVFVAASKGLVAGLTNMALALVLGAKLPALWLTTIVAVVGFVGYGLSLVLFVLALRALGSARTAAYFGISPFVGATIAIGVFHEPLSWPFCIGALLTALGVWLHLAEQHGHEHVHEALTHSHRHRHDLHHQHVHPFAWDGREPHTHEHQHAHMQHAHRHYPDLHHRHEHKPRDGSSRRLAGGGPGH